MGVKLGLGLLKVLGSAAAVGVGAQLAKGSAGKTRKRKRGCTPCAAMAQMDQAKQAVKTGRL